MAVRFQNSVAEVGLPNSIQSGPGFDRTLVPYYLVESLIEIGKPPSYSKPPAFGELLPDITARWLDSAMAVLDEHYRIVAVNQEMAGWLGVQAEGKSFLEVLPAGCHDWKTAIGGFLRSTNRFNRVELESGEIGNSRYYTLEITNCGTTLHLLLRNRLRGEISTALQNCGSGAEMHPVAEVIVTRMLRAEAQLKNLTEQFPGAIFSQRPDFSLHFVSPRFIEFTGITQEIWRNNPDTFWNVIHEADLHELLTHFKKHQANANGTTTYRIRHLRTGRVRYVMEQRVAVMGKDGTLLGYEAMWLDITRQAIAERRLSSASWKETLTVITMGLAHDFNNVLTGIHALVETYLGDLKPEDPFYEGLQLIKHNSLQASHVVQRIKNLHLGKVGERNYHDLNGLVADTSDVLAKILPKRITLKTELCSEALALYLDAVEFRQVLINLCLNAADAMPNGGKLSLIVSLEKEVPEQKYKEGFPPRLPAVCLSIKDSGTGISSRDLPFIFDPFFTTKAVNKGSGLGLYNARLFVERHKAMISVNSTESVGTTFQLWFPLADFSETERNMAEDRDFRKMLLYVDAAGKKSEEFAEYLRERNFYVAAADSELTALDFLISPDYPFDAVFIDLGDPSMFPLKVLAEARHFKPPLKTILHYNSNVLDQFETSLLARVDLMITADTPRENIPGMIARLLNTRSI